MDNLLKLGIATVQQQRERAPDVASGKRKRKPDEPTGWFPSVSVAVRILSEENIAILKRN